MDISEINHFITTLKAQGCLSQDSKNKICEMTLNIDQVLYMRNYAFDRVYKNLNTDLQNNQQQVNWLEQLIKTPDTAYSDSTCCHCLL